MMQMAEGAIRRLAGLLALLVILGAAPAHAQGPAAPAPAAGQERQAPAQALPRPDKAAGQKAPDGFAAPAREGAAPAPPQPSRARLAALSDIRLAASRAERMIPEAEKTLARARQKIARPDVSLKDLDAERATLEKLRLSLLAARKELEGPLENVRRQLKALGPPPKDGAAEDAAIAAQRKALREVLDRLDAADKKLALLALNVSQLSARAADRQRQLFLSEVFQPGRSVLNPLLWLDGMAQLPDFMLRLKVLLSKWSRGEQQGGNMLFVSVLALFTASLVFLVYVWRRWRRPLEAGVPPDDFRYLWRAVRVAVYSALVVFAMLLLLNVAIYSISTPSPRIARLIDSLTMAILFAAVTMAMARGIFRPVSAHMRLVDLSDADARRAYHLASLIILLHALDYLMGDLATILFMPVAFTESWSAFVSILYIMLIGLFLMRIRQGQPLSAEEGQARPFYFHWARYLFHVVWLVLLVAALALLLGYVALAHYITTKMVQTASLLTALYLLHHLADALVRNALDGQSYTGAFLRKGFSLPERTITQLGVLFSTLVDVLTVAVGLPLVLMIWSVNWTDLTNWAQAAFFGFKVGNITIEPASILLGVLVLVLGLILARLVTLWLDRRVLERMNLDSGVRHSLVTTSKYALTIGAVLVALSVAGVNYTSLAFMGGALGIGIGFGLKEIVSNFVSGLILLAERPIKVGDWIKVSGGEGIVRRIKVRSTEIETFDRCSIIVPNSSLIVEPVSNWYHSSRMGRLRLPIGVSYDADPDEVEQILLRCARAHPRALAAPKAFVLFTGFGDNSLDFELRVYIDDAGALASTGSDLRFAIFRELKKAGIEIPFPQRDIHVRSMPPELFDRGEVPEAPRG